MANITKVSPYRSGAPRFGLKSQPFDNSVKISYLTPEELEEYRSGKRGGSKLFTYDEYQEMRAAGKSNQEIAKQMNISEGTLYNRIKVWKESSPKNAQKAPNLVEKVSETTNTTQDKNDEYKRIMEELKAKMESSNKEKDEIIHGLEKKVEYWKQVAEHLENENKQVAELQAALNDSWEQFNQATIEKDELRTKVLNLEKELEILRNNTQVVAIEAGRIANDIALEKNELQTKYNELLDNYYTLKEEITPLRQLTLLKLRSDMGVLHEEH